MWLRRWIGSEFSIWIAARAQFSIRIAARVLAQVQSTDGYMSHNES